MNIDIAKKGKVFVLALKENRLDSTMSQEFESTVKQWIAGGETCILLDLVNVNFVDSAGLGSIVSCMKNLKTKDSDGYLALTGISDQIMSLFKLTRMDRIFSIYSNQAEALQNL